MTCKYKVIQGVGYMRSYREAKFQLQVTFCKRATDCRALLRKETYEDKASCASCRKSDVLCLCEAVFAVQVSFRKRATAYGALLRKMKYKDKDKAIQGVEYMRSFVYVRLFLPYRSLFAKEPLLTGLCCGK